MKEEKSQCCKATKEAIYSDEGTGHYICSKCKSEFIPESSEEKEEEYLISGEDLSITPPDFIPPFSIPPTVSEEKKTWSNKNNESPVLTPEYIQNSILPQETKDFMIKNIPWKKDVSTPPTDSNWRIRFDKEFPGEDYITLEKQFVRSFIEDIIQSEREKVIKKTTGILRQIGSIENDEDMEKVINIIKKAND